MPRADRGAYYGAQHRANRKTDEPIVLAGAAVCGFCRCPIVAAKIRLRPSQSNPLGRLVWNWDWDHRTGAPAHLACNRSDGARKGNRGRRRISALRTWGAW